MSLRQLARISNQRLRSVFRRGALDNELSRELSFHFEQLVEEQLAEGKPLREARLAARRALGNVAVLEEQCRDQRRVAWLHDLHQDLIFVLRMLRKTPVFTTFAVISLAVGIGANAAILAGFDRVLIEALPFPAADGLVIVRTVQTDNPSQRSLASIPDYVAWRDRHRSFDTIGASISDQRDFGAEGDMPPERIQGQLFTPGVFAALGIRPLVGRVFTEADVSVDNPARIVVISHRLWTQRFGADPNVLGRVVRMNAVATSIVGVMPPGFAYPNHRVDYWAPLAVSTAQLQGSPRFYQVVARCARGVSIHQAEADVQAVAADLARGFPDRHSGWSVRLQPIRDALFGWALRPLLTLQAAAALILMIACANVAGLLLARGSTRGPEVALRMALGAGRGRIVRQLLAESVLLSLLGGALAIPVALWGFHTFVVMGPTLGAPAIGPLVMNARVFGVLVLLAAATSVLFGIAPALATSNLRLSAPANELARSTGTRRQQRLRGALVATQVSLALILLVGAGLLVNSFLRLSQREFNFEPRRLLTFEYRIPGAEFMRPIGSYAGFPYFAISPAPSLVLERLYDRLGQVPGVESVAGVSHRPLNSLLLPVMPIAVEGRSVPPGSAETVTYLIVTPNFFATMKASLVSGRDFGVRDRRSASWVALINETAAHRFWPGTNAIGRRFRLDTVPEEQPREVVGVVRDLPLSHIQTEPKAVVYASYLQQPSRYRGPWAAIFGQMTFVLRTTDHPNNLVPAVRKAVADVDPNQPASGMTPIMMDLAIGLLRRRQFASVLAGFALVATLLAAVGVYGLMAYSVAQRTREIGIRRTLGAGHRDLVLMVARRAAALVAVGVIVGVAGAFLLTRLIASQLWMVTPTDPMTFGVVSLLLVAVALVAAIVPVRSALRVNPTIALKYE